LRTNESDTTIGMSRAGVRLLEGRLFTELEARTLLIWTRAGALI
jgi:hypothetical protein